MSKAQLEKHILRVCNERDNGNIAYTYARILAGIEDTNGIVSICAMVSVGSLVVGIIFNLLGA